MLLGLLSLSYLCDAVFVYMWVFYFTVCLFVLNCLYSVFLCVACCLRLICLINTTYLLAYLLKGDLSCCACWDAPRATPGCSSGFRPPNLPAFAWRATGDISAEVFSTSQPSAWRSLEETAKQRPFKDKPHDDDDDDDDDDDHLSVVQLCSS